MQQQCETLLNTMVDRLPEDKRPALRERIEQAVLAQAGAEGPCGPTAYRFLKDLSLFLNMRGPDFIYSRGIAESLRVGEDIFELAYVLKKAM